MATKKSTPAKKATPAKKQKKTVAKTTVKAVAKKTATKKSTATKAAAKKKTAPAKTKTAAAKKTAAKATPAKKAATKKQTTVKSTAAKAKAAPQKTATKKAEPKQAVKAAGSQSKTQQKTSPKKEQSTPTPVVPKLSTKSSVKYQPEFTKSILDTPKDEPVKPVVRYSDAELQEFKEIILKKLDAAKKELAYLQGLITRRDEGGDMDEGRYMTMEDGSVSMEREQLSQLASRQIQFIDHLEKALMRVENKTYGICRVTGNLIDKARLRAVPHATLSIEAKSMLNNNK
ncbi:RNA polymerase-binding transcription factor DksA [Mycovorax composti]|jgi:DnaK suppressor protein|uniref:RNA polymerase-binding transcription factor DksA n=2 Tax=Chitinophagaceae TaxID=563835 RepID=A0ABZ2EG73_9BACT